MYLEVEDCIMTTLNIPTIEEVEQCYSRLLNAGGLLPLGTKSFEDDFFQSTITRAAKIKVIEGVGYWEALKKPDTKGLIHELSPQIPDSDEFPF